MPGPTPPPGPWYTFGLGGQLLATNALAFGIIVAATYLLGLALLGALVSLLWLLLFGLCWPCGSFSCSSGGGSCCGSGSGSGGGTCCSGSASAGGGGGCCGGSAGASGSGGSSGGCCSGSGSASGAGHVGTNTGSVSVGAPGEGVAATASMLAGSAFLRAPALRTDLRDRWAHHPPSPAFAQDVFRLAGLRICAGCATVLPAFLLPTLWVSLHPLAAWWTGLAVGVPLAGAQGISSLGWARRRWQKVLVKSGLGVGLALAVAGVLAAPWSHVAKVAALCGFLALAWLSTVPRRRRLEAWAESAASKS